MITLAEIRSAAMSVEFTNKALAPSAHEAKKLGGHPDTAKFIRTDWEQVKFDLMRKIIRAKCEQHEYVREQLAKTKGLLLVEDSPKDSFWGRGPD